MDPEIVERLNEQLRDMSDIISQQNASMAAMIKTMQAQGTTVAANNNAINASSNMVSGMTRRQRAMQEAEEAREKAAEQANLAIARFNNLLDRSKNVIGSFSTAMLDTNNNLQKYNGVISMAGDKAVEVGRRFGILGTVLGEVVKGFTVLVEKQLIQADNLLTFSDQISRLGAVNAYSTKTLLDMAHSVGLTSGELDKLSKPIQGLGNSFKSIGQGAADSTQKFIQMAAVTEDVRNEFRMLGFNDQERIEAQAQYIEQMAATGVALRGMEKSSTNLQKSSLDYVKNLTILSEITGKTNEEQAKAQQMATANYQYQLYVQNTRRKIDETSDPQEKARLFKELEQAQVAVERIRALRGDEAALGFTERLQGRAQTLGLAGQALANTKGEEDAILRAVKQGTFEGQAVAEAQTALRDKNTKLYNNESGLGTALLYSKELQDTTGGLAPLTETNNLMGMNTEEIAAETKRRQDELSEGKGEVADDAAQKTRNFLKEEVERPFGQFIDNLVGAFNPFLGNTGAFAVLAGAAVVASIALGKLAMAGTAAMAGKIAGAAPGLLGRLAGGGATAAGATAAGATAAAPAVAGATAASKGAKLAGLAKGGARILGKLAWPLTAIMALGDGISGFGADPNASFGGKLANAGKSALSGATFGLLGTSAEEIAARKAQSKTGEQTTSQQSKEYAESQFNRSIGTFASVVTSFAKTVTAFAVSTRAFAISINKLSEVIKLQSKTSVVDLIAQKLGPQSTERLQKKQSTLEMVLGKTLTETDDTLSPLERFEKSITGLTSDLTNLREAETKRHAFNELSMRQFRQSLDEASKKLDLLSGNTSDDKTKDDDGTSDSSSTSPSAPSDPGSAPGSRVVEAGKGYTTIESEDGRVEKRTGSRNWRNNNPGNLEYGEFAKSQGAIGSDGRFAVFANYEQGRAAKETLLFEGSKYKGLTIGEAIKRYAPPKENNTGRYIKTVTKAIGRNANTPLEDLTREQRTAMMNAMEKVEGFKQGKTEVLREGSPNTIGKDLNLPPARSAGGIVPLGKALQALGLRVDENIHFDGKHPRRGAHSRKGGHYDGTAIDVNAPGGIVEANDKKWRSKFDQIAMAGAAAGYHTLWRSPDGNHDNHIHFQYSGSMGKNSNVGGRRGKTLQARKGGIFDGPDSGYPVEMHGGEMIAPLSTNSVLMKLAKTPVESEQMKQIAAPTNSVEKETIEKIVSMNSEMMDSMISKLDDMVNAISDGNETRQKILKNSQ